MKQFLSTNEYSELKTEIYQKIQNLQLFESVKFKLQCDINISYKVLKIPGGYIYTITKSCQNQDLKFNNSVFVPDWC